MTDFVILRVLEHKVMLHQEYDRCTVRASWTAKGYDEDFLEERRRAEGGGGGASKV